MAKVNFKPVASLLVIARQLSKTVALTLGLIAFSFLFVWYIFAWTEPSAVPPGDNVPAPLNVGPDAQAKEGMLWLAYNPAVTTGLIVEYGNVGIGTTGPNYSLHVVNPANPDKKMFFDSAKGAFRAGGAINQLNQWDDVNIGDYSTAMGWGTKASGPESTAIGLETIASGYASFATGEFSEAWGDQAIAMGRLAIASGQYVPVAIGENVTASGARSAIAIGRKITASGTFSMVLGHGTEIENARIVNNVDNSLMVGFNSDIPTLFVGPSSGVGTTGNVGIGTAGPGKKLDVVGGEIRSDTGLCITGASPECISDWPAGGGGFWAASGVDDIYNTNTGNVGIGTASPAGLLNVRGYIGGTGGSALAAHTKNLVIGGGNWNQPYNSGNANLLWIGDYSNDAGDDVYPIYVEDENNVVEFFLHSGTTGSSAGKKAYFAGNVGIGTTDPGAKLEVSSGKIRVRGGELNSAYVDISGEGKALGAGWYGRIQVRDDNPSSGTAHTLSLNPQGGYVGIGTTDPTSNLHVNGLPEYADNADANANGLTAGAFYRTGDVLKVVHH